MEGELSIYWMHFKILIILNKKLDRESQDTSIGEKAQHMES